MSNPWDILILGCGRLGGNLKTELESEKFRVLGVRRSQIEHDATFLSLDLDLSESWNRLANLPLSETVTDRLGRVQEVRRQHDEPGKGRRVGRAPIERNNRVARKRRAIALAGGGAAGGLISAAGLVAARPRAFGRLRRGERRPE